ncbi:MAG: DUF3427 domain-containing protein [Sphingobacteriales bacterium]|nr:MAG: DUF3427 domain-containing protein [Sphingobacteriales bacterium]
MTNAHSKVVLGSQYTKTDLSKIFNEPNLEGVREGIYSLKPHNAVLLFVDLVKAGKEDRFHFNDYFDGDVFHWDSQTTQNINSPRIQSIVRKQVEVLLFCRLQRKIKNITQPFYYCGTLEYLEHDLKTANPVHLVFLSNDFNETTSNLQLKILYEWKPENIGKATSNNDYHKNGTAVKFRVDQKKPNYTERKGLVTSRRTRWNA